VREHGPEPPECFGPDINPEQGNVTFEEGLHETPTPKEALAGGSRKIAMREAPAHPETIGVSDPNFVQSKACQGVVCDAPGEGLRTLSHEMRGSAPQNQESGCVPRPIRQHTQHRKQLGLALNLVDYNQSLQRREGQHWICETSNVNGVLKIEIRSVPSQASHHHARQRGLSHLSGTQDANHRKGAKERLHSAGLTGAVYHSLFLYIENSVSYTDISR
jgi:hypothetical protein